MSEKIDAIHDSVKPPAGNGATHTRDGATPRRAFADILAEAEAVQDDVHVRPAGVDTPHAFRLAPQPTATGSLWLGLAPWWGSLLHPQHPEDSDPADDSEA